MRPTLAVAAWLTVVTACSIGVWAVISSAGSDVLRPSTLPGATTSSPQARPWRRPTSTARPQTVQRVWQGPPGVVVAECTGSRIFLRGAQANDPWGVRVGSRGPEHGEVRFEAGEEREAEVVVRCRGGVPRFSSSGDG